MRSQALEALRVQLHNGYFTERQLARLAKLSQPQVHNLLKGKRKAHIETLDKLLAAARIDRTGKLLD
jgi:transcriptional regulator with XRE-family HTH domain